MTISTKWRALARVSLEKQDTIDKNCEHNWCQIEKDLPNNIGDKSLK
jgi:hypothetical protein